MGFLPRLALFSVLALALATAAPAPAGAQTSAGRLVSIARSELARNVHEIPDGSNRAPRIRMYGQSTTPHYYPAPWCAYFVSWVARHAGVPIGPGGNGLGYVPYIRSWAKATGRARRYPRPGYLITFPQHVGLVEAVYSNGTITTIEGNYSNRVTRVWRRASEATSYVALGGGGGVTPAPPKPQPPKSNPQAGRLVARIKAYPGTEVAVGQRVDFTSQESSGDVRGAEWDLDGNGSYETRGDEVSFTYKTPGRRLVKLRIWDARGNHKTASAWITVADNKAPVAKLQLSATTLEPGDTLVGDASGSFDPDGRIVRYEWDLNGDGHFGQDGVRHTQTLHYEGTYVVGLRVTDDKGAQAIATATVTVKKPAPPVAHILCDKADIHVGDTVTCSSDDSGSAAAIRRYEWDLNGDGQFSRGSSSASYTYHDAGTYNATLRVTDVNGQQSTTSVEVSVHNEPPVASFTLASTTVHVGEEIVADASASYDPDGTISGYEWDLNGDGSWGWFGAQHASHIDTPGTYSVGLRVHDDDGAVTEVHKQVKVLPPPPQPAISAPDKPLVGQQFTLDGSGSTASGATIVAYRWDLNGDGHYDDASGPSAPLKVSQPGTVTVGLKVFTDAGDSAVVTRSIKVYAPPTLKLVVPASARVGDYVKIDASGSTDADGTITNYKYDIDNNGTWERNGTSSSYTVRYSTAGTYTVKARVTDNDGLYSESTATITIG